MLATASSTATVAFAAPPGESFDLLDQMGVRMAFARDEEIFAQEEEADLIYRVISGSVRTTRLMADGRRQVGEFYYAGEIFGLEPGAEHRFSAEALTDCVILVLKRSAVRTLAETDSRLERLLWAATARALDRAQEHLLLLCRKTACEKVASFLMDVADRQKAPSALLPMGRQDMADYLGLTIETVSRMLGQLQTSAMVRFTETRRFQITNREAFARLCA